MTLRLPRLVALGLSIVVLGAPTGHGSVVSRVSVSSSGAEASGGSHLPAVSADGQYVAFVSFAPDLVPADGDTKQDVFVHDRATGATVLVSKSSEGVKGDRDSGNEETYGVGGPGISATGRYVVFTSLATNLVNDAATHAGIYVHDRDADGNGIFDEPGGIRTIRASVASDGTEPDGTSQFPGISADGRVVVYSSFASNLVPGGTNGQRQVYAYDRDADGNGIFDEPGGVATTRVSVSTSGVEGDGESGRPDVQVSADGTIVAFTSYATNLVPNDQNDRLDVFLRDRVRGTTERANVADLGGETFYYDTYEFALSGDGRFVAFATSDPTLVLPPPGYGGVMNGSDVYVRDRLTGRTTTWADGAPAGRVVRTASYRPALSYDGRYLAFYTRFGPMFRPDGSDGKNRVELYVHDRVAGTTATRPIQASDGAHTTVDARGIGISADGRTVVFDSEGSALVANDHNAARDVFVDSCPVVVAGAGITSCDPPPFPGLAAADLAVFARGAAQFERIDSPAEGLGPIFNGASCAECHNRPWIGGTSDRQVTRIGTTGPGGFDPLVASGGPILQSQGIDTPACTVAGEVVPPAATIVSRRDVPALFGVGLIEALPEAAILRLADPTDANGDGVSGRPNLDGGRVGRFGRKAQIATLRRFAGEAYLMEMGITSPEFPTENQPQGVPLACDPVPDPEDDGTNVARFVDFLAGLAPVPSGRYADASAKRTALHGRSAFRRIGCARCHSERLRVTGTVLRPLGLKKVTIYSDLLLHDMGPDLADGIVQGDATGSEFRTAPLWGVAFSAPYLHDGRAATLDAAILAHGGEAQAVRDAFATLGAADRAAVLAFLGSL